MHTIADKQGQAIPWMALVTVLAVLLLVWEPQVAIAHTGTCENPLQCFAQPCAVANCKRPRLDCFDEYCNCTARCGCRRDEDCDSSQWCRPEPTSPHQSSCQPRCAQQNCLIQPCSVVRCGSGPCVDDYCTCTAKCTCKSNANCTDGYCGYDYNTGAKVCKPFAGEFESCTLRGDGPRCDASEGYSCVGSRGDRDRICLKRCNRAKKCDEGEFCGNRGFCLSGDGDEQPNCLTTRDCYNPNNGWVHILCTGTASCVDNHCAWTCSSTEPGPEAGGK